jgi:hypothetical protein
MPRAMAEERPGRGQVRWRSVAGWNTKLQARMASPHESALFAEAKNSGEPSDGLMLVYLVELDGEAPDDESAGPGEFPPHRT